MKQILFSAAFILFSTITFAQQSLDSTKVEQYCELTAEGAIMTGKVFININYGKDQSYSMKDLTIKDKKTGEFKTINNVADALNYMGYNGWTIVTKQITKVPNSTDTQYSYTFKKIVNKKD